MNNKNESFFEIIIEKVFYLIKFPDGIIGGILGQVAAVLVEIAVNIFKAVE